MKTTKTITVSGEEILKDYICQALNLTVIEYDKKFKNNPPKVFWNIEEEGDYDRGTYDRFLKEITITIDE